MNVINFIILMTVSFATSTLYLHEIISSKSKNISKIIAFCIDWFHVFITYFCVIASIYFVIALLTSVVVSHKLQKQIIAFNLLVLIIIILFFYNRMCILTIWYNKLLNLNKCTPFTSSFIARLKNNNHNNSYYFQNNDNCYKNMFAWMSSYKYLIIILAFIDIIFYLRF